MNKNKSRNRKDNNKNKRNSNSNNNFGKNKRQRNSRSNGFNNESRNEFKNKKRNESRNDSKNENKGELKKDFKNNKFRDNKFNNKFNKNKKTDFNNNLKNVELDLNKDFVEIEKKLKNNKTSEPKIKYGRLNKKSLTYGFLEPVNIEEEASLKERLQNKMKYFEVITDDLYIKGENIKFVNSGDIVSIKNVLKSTIEGGRDEAEVDKILLRNKRLVVGTFTRNENFSFVVPDEKTFISDIFISKTRDMDAKTDDKVVVEVLKYSKGVQNSEGRVVKILGNKNDPEVTLLSLLEDKEIEIEFPDKVLKQVNKIEDSLTEEEIEKSIKNDGRVDLRNLKTKTPENLRVYTIDGKDAKDLDDAVAIEKLGNKYRVWIHIADVSHYVKEGTALDFEALLRSNSIYLIDTVVPMLPKKLSNGICSLNVGEDRFTVTVSVDIDFKGNFLNFKIFESIINVDKRLNYDLVQEILDKSENKKEKQNKTKPETEIETENIKNEITYTHNNLNVDIDYIDVMNLKFFEDIAKILIEKRTQNGYINFEIPETIIELDSEKRPINIYREEEIFSNRIIEQLMLTANEIVGKVSMDNNIPAIYRVHENPNVDKILEVNQLLKIMGVQVKISTRKNAEGKDEKYIESFEYTRVLNEIKEKLKLKEENYFRNNGQESMQDKVEIIFRFLQYMLLRSMMVAKYSSKPTGHFGLGSKNYLHFTAPIRRYADLFVHRNLKKYIVDKGKGAKLAKEDGFDIADVISKKISDKERKSIDIEREYYRMKKAEYMQKYIGDIFGGVITKVTNYGMFIELTNSIEGFVRFEEMKDIYEKNSEGKAVGKKRGNVYSIGDTVKILITNVNLDTHDIYFNILNEFEEEK